VTLRTESGRASILTPPRVETLHLLHLHTHTHIHTYTRKCTLLGCPLKRDKKFANPLITLQIVAAQIPLGRRVPEVGAPAYGGDNPTLRGSLCFKRALRCSTP
jgi:hypothetical protein